ncbi:MAG: TIGR04282 family arsenosugar biosynthesis glycosyltransferase [Planctomycetota bacterium]|nr:TIGR04282 family arsenosugar biosynthesis glycosyltransferase [Planctomycetota bacterium]
MNKRSTPTHLGIFVKAPKPGKVKTRLARSVGLAAARDLYVDMATDTLQWAQALNRCRTTVFYSPAGDLKACRKLLPEGAPEPFFEPQCSGSLGRRMQAAFTHMFQHGAKSAILIGSDCPLLERELVRQAFTALRNKDLVLGPAADGGYYLIGLRRPAPELFKLRHWSHAGVLEATLDTASKLDLSSRILPVLSDIDQGEDLPHLGRELLAAWLKCRKGRRKDFPLRVFRRLFWEPGTQIYQLAKSEPHQPCTEDKAQAQKGLTAFCSKLK